MPNFVKQAVDISFGKGLDTKTDPWRVPIGNFLRLDNMVFTKGLRLTKRNGYAPLNVTVNTSATPASLSSTKFLTTFNGNLTAVGQNLLAYSKDTKSWFNKGSLQPVKLATLPLIRSNTNQSQVDTAIASNGLVCTVYTDQTPTSLSTPRYMYAVADSVTGQNITIPTPIPVSSGTITGSPRVFVLGPYFIIVFTNLITATYHLQYVAVSVNNPTIVTTNADIASSYIPANTLSWDGVVVENHLYFAYNTTAGGQQIKVTYLTSTLTLATPASFTTLGRVTATAMSMCVDNTNPSSPVIWAAYYNSATNHTDALAVDLNLHTVLSPTQVLASGDLANITSVASNGILTIYYEINNNYGYDATIPTHYVSQITCTQAGSVGSSSIVVRSVGLYSKAFIDNGKYYFVAAYQSTYQPTYFLINQYGQVVAKLAYANGGGYATTGLTSVTVNGSVAMFGYLFKDFITSQNTSTTESISKSNIYSQTGLNLASLSIGTSNVAPAEIGQALHLSGGFLWEYDGYQPVEHNFFLWPDSIAGVGANNTGSMKAQEYQYHVVYSWCDNQGNIHYSSPSIPLIVDMSTNNPNFTPPTPITFTADLASGSAVLHNVSTFSGIEIGQVITDTTTGAHIQTGSYIVAFDAGASTITLNLPATATASGDSLSTSTICTVTLQIPTLRLTYKTANPVKINIYRWSTDQQEFFQVTSISQPFLNNVTVDSLQYIDAAADNQISGNSLVYTTGGVVENIGAPSFNSITLFDDRLWGLDAEDQNLLWYSKQVIETTPVEMSDLLTVYVAPSIASQGSTGNIKCIAPMDDKLIMFKPNALYYINGTGPDNTGANSQYSQPIFITSVVGSTNQQSIVFMPDGLMFQSDKGIWLLSRGLGVSYIGAPVESYTEGATVQSAVCVPGTTQVRFTLDTGITLVYDYYYQQWGTFSGVAAISSTLYEDLHTFLNSFGQVYQESPGTYLDGSNPVKMSFTTSWINLAGLQGYQRAYFCYLLGEYLSPHFLQVGVAYDYNPNVYDSVTITPNNYASFYGKIGPFGQQAPYGGPSAKEQWRVFFSKQRCQAFQIQLQELYDPSLGVPAGPGLTISGLNLIVAAARSFRAIGSATSAGTGNTKGSNQ